MLPVNSSDIKTTKDLLDIAKDVFSWFKGEKDESLHIDCMNNLGIYSTTVNVNSFLAKIAFDRTKRIQKFDSNKIYDVKVYGIKPFGGRIYDAVSREGNLIVLDLNKLVQYDQFRCEISCIMNRDFFEGLVYGRSSPEPLENATKFNLTAQLKDPNGLIKGFSEIDIDNYPVSADVYIKEQINTNIAPFLKQLSITEYGLIREKDIHQTYKWKMEQKRLKKKGKNKEFSDWLNGIRQFLDPQQFLHYIDRTQSKDFRLHNCEWGDIFQALGLVALPEKMHVINRTDLTVKNPAKSGVIIYNSQEFSKEFEKKFGTRQ